MRNQVRDMAVLMAWESLGSMKPSKRRKILQEKFKLTEMEVEIIIGREHRIATLGMNYVGWGY